MLTYANIPGTFYQWQEDEIDDEITLTLDVESALLMCQNIPGTFYQWQKGEIDDKISC